ncbi:MAG: sigma-70 family RNA polymerase sigma factor [Gemmataceae bacterium]
MASGAAAVLRRAAVAAAKATAGDLSDGDLLRRFADGDQAAFALVVARHTPMVFGVCRRALRSAADAEDACQAAFLALARKATAVRWQASVANWLYSAARKTAANARRAAVRRAAREARAAVPEAVEPVDAMTGRELLAALDEELDRLSATYREPLVLCYLEGLSRDEAALRLRIPAGTVKIRLERGRKKLADALTRRGVVGGIGLLTLAVTSPAGASPLRTVEAVLRAAAGIVPPRVAALVEGVAVNGLLNKSLLAAALVGVVTAGIGAGTLRSPAGQPPDNKMPAKPVAAERPAVVTPVRDEAVSYRGRVVGPDGQPVAGAALYVSPSMGYGKDPFESPRYATTGADGRFEFAIPAAKYRDQHTVVAAAAANFGPDWAEVPPGGGRGELTLRLVPDDVPFTGRIVDLEGRPVAGATLRVLQINAAPGEDLGPWLKAIEEMAGNRFDLEQKYVGRFTVALSPAVATDADGRVRLTGVGRNRIVHVQLDGPTVASQQFSVLTRPGKAVQLPTFRGTPPPGDAQVMATYYGPDFRHAAAPTKPVVGVVRDKDTRKPLAGVTVQSFKLANYPIPDMPIVRATTDADGRFRLVGLPKGRGNTVKLVPPDDVPYVATLADVPDTPGLAPVAVDLELKRGVWIEGTLTDKLTGKPLRGAVAYLSLDENPHLRDYPGFVGMHINTADKDDGTYRVVGLPGPGLVGVYHPHDYLRAPERDDEFGAKEGLLQTALYQFSTDKFSALTPIDPAAGAAAVRRDVTLDPGWTFKATVVGPDGRPLAGARTGFRTLGVPSWDRDVMPTAEFTVLGFNPRRPCDTYVTHAAKNLAGVVPRPKANGEAVAVRLEAGATVVGRLVDADGKPRGGVELAVYFHTRSNRKFWTDYSPDRTVTDADGRFRMAALVPDHDYMLDDGRGDVRFGDGLRPGEVKDLGDVRAKPRE